MIIGASIYYLIATLTVVWFAWRRGGIASDCAVALLIWDAMANATYRSGEVEIFSTVAISFVFIAFTVFLFYRWQFHWMPLYLALSGIAILFWNALPQHDPYVYKAVKNGIYLAMLVVTGVGTWTTSRTISAPS